MTQMHVAGNSGWPRPGGLNPSCFNLQLGARLCGRAAPGLCAP